MISLLLLLVWPVHAADSPPSSGAALTAETGTETGTEMATAVPLPATVAGWRELYVALRQLHDHHGQPLALGAVGPDARRVAHKSTALFTGGEVVLRPVPTAGDPAAELALTHTNTGASCVVWMTPAGSGWQLSPRGDCRPATASASAAAEAELPPLLRVVPRRGDPPWRIYDDAGRRVDTWRYASLTRDPDLRDRLVVERRRHRLGARLLEIGGIALAGAAVVPLVQSVGLSHELAEDRRLTAVFMVGSGGLLYLGGRLDRHGLDARQAEVGHYVHRTDAEAAVDDWNQEALRRRARIQADAGATVSLETDDEEAP